MQKIKWYCSCEDSKHRTLKPTKVKNDICIKCNHYAVANYEQHLVVNTKKFTPKNKKLLNDWLDIINDYGGLKNFKRENKAKYLYLKNKTGYYNEIIDILYDKKN